MIHNTHVHTRTQHTHTHTHTIAQTTTTPSLYADRFVRRRGFVSMLRSVGRLVVMGFPALVIGTIDRVGWRATLRLLALVIGVAGVCAASLLVDTPEECGLRPDGMSESESDDGGDITANQHETNNNNNNTVKGDDSPAAEALLPNTAPSTSVRRQEEEPMWQYTDAVREPFLHALILTDAVAILFFTGVNVHFVDLFQTQCGLPKEAAAGLTMWMSGGLLVGQLAVGSRLDIWPPEWRRKLLGGLYALILCCQGGLLLLRPRNTAHIEEMERPHGTSATPLADESPGLLRAAACWYFVFGFAFGGIIIFRSFMVPDVFGRKALGRISALYTGVGTAASGLGPLLFGYLRSDSGGYRAAIATSLVLLSISAACLMLRKVPSPPTPGDAQATRGAPQQVVGGEPSAA